MKLVIGPVYRFIRYSGCGNSFDIESKVYIISKEVAPWVKVQKVHLVQKKNLKRNIFRFVATIKTNACI